MAGFASSPANDFKDGADLDRDAIRGMLRAEKSAAAFAILPLEKCSGSFTRDFFGDEESTFSDDVQQFFTLQREAVGTLELHRRFVFEAETEVSGKLAPSIGYT